MDKKFEIDFGGRPLIIETDLLAPRADAALKVRYGDTVVLVTVVMEDKPRSGVSYFPLMVNYEEKLYAAGMIKGSRWVKREGRPSDEAIISSRLLDRAIRPRFNSAARNAVQIIATVLSIDDDNDPDIPALIGASTALHISSIPWDGPLAAVRIGRCQGEWIKNPTFQQREKGDCDLVVAGDGQVINMLDFKGDQVPEEDFINAVNQGKGEIKKMVAFQNKIRKEIGTSKGKMEIPSLPEGAKKAIDKYISGRIEDAVYTGQMEVSSGITELKEELLDHLSSRYKAHYDWEEVKDACSYYFEEKVEEFVKREILEKERRPDGRGLKDIRPLACKTGFLPRTHGSALFSRGLTQALSIVTLAGPGLEQMLEEIEQVGTKRFMHHYNFPPYSVGEVRPIRGPGRREIGHGMIAERALRPLLPEKKDFPYTIRVVSEILSSNGSSSMASVCGSTLSLLDAGVRLKNNAAGVAMGLVMGNEENYKILTDIQGPEDHHGDMDLKVAGTRQGITAVQMDVKIKGLTMNILKEALGEARKARLRILETMETTIKEPNELSPYAPNITRVKIDPEQISEVIGPGGRVIKQITQSTGTQIDIEEDGQVFITGETDKASEAAASFIRNIVREIKPGEVVKGTVTKITDFGAFVEIAPGKEGLIHISNLKKGYVKDVRDVVKVGDKVKVKVIEIDDMGRINFKLVSKIS